MAEVEVGGIKFRGGKIFVILAALSTAGGALWGGFEFYKDYLNMKEQIQNYVAPDLSEFDKEIGFMQTIRHAHIVMVSWRGKDGVGGFIEVRRVRGRPISPSHSSTEPGVRRTAPHFW